MIRKWAPGEPLSHPSSFFQPKATEVQKRNTKIRECFLKEVALEGWLRCSPGLCWDAGSPIMAKILNADPGQINYNSHNASNFLPCGAYPSFLRLKSLRDNIQPYSSHTGTKLKTLTLLGQGDELWVPDSPSRTDAKTSFLGKTRRVDLMNPPLPTELCSAYLRSHLWVTGKQPDPIQPTGSKLSFSAQEQRSSDFIKVSPPTGRDWGKNL